ncbi:MAG: hypothetical protein R3A10_07160 [Caldilineaceae bacterium]
MPRSRCQQISREIYIAAGRTARVRRPDPAIYAAMEAEKHHRHAGGLLHVAGRIGHHGRVSPGR